MSKLEIITHDIALPKMERHMALDGRPGADINFSCLNEFYTHKDGGVTDWTGVPGSGKTYFVLEIMFGLAEQYGKRTLLYIPDVGSDEEIMEKLVKMRTGKDMNSKYNNKISSEELLKAMPWIMHHFVIVGRGRDAKGNRHAKPTPMELWEFGCKYSDDGGEVHQVLIDSWKNMMHIYDGREDQYLDQILSDRNEMAEDYGKHLHTIAHATKPKNIGNKRVIPNAYDIKGGGSWFDNGKSIITVDFPDKQMTNVNLYVSKAKPENVGQQGSIVDKIYLDKHKGRYYERIGTGLFYAFDYKKLHTPAKNTLDLPPIDLNTQPSPI